MREVKLRGGEERRTRLKRRGVGEERWRGGEE